MLFHIFISLSSIMRTMDVSYGYVFLHLIHLYILIGFIHDLKFVMFVIDFLYQKQI